MYMIAGVYVCSVGLVSVIEPWMELPCDDSMDKVIQFANPVYPDASRCRHLRYILLLGFTPTECAYARRLVGSVLMGGLIGWERRQADRPAGIRTMSLVSLGSCLFTITSTFAFLNGPMSWDASRVSAAIPSGVGFLGAGLIFKKEETNSFGDSNHVVHGLTTAASVWLSAAVGIACGGDLYMPASFGVAIMMLLLRFGPRGNEGEDMVRGLEFDEELNEKMTDDDGIDGTRSNQKLFDPLIASGGASLVDGNKTISDYASIHNINEEGSVAESFRGGALSQRVEFMSTDAHRRAMSVRRRQAALGSMF